jgi:acetyl-CoA carboxylase biotin carboxyl carrier protein
MNLDVIKDILNLVREHDLAELEIESDGLKVRVKKAGQAVAMAPPAVAVLPSAVPASVPGPVAASIGEASAPTAIGGVELAVIKSPIVGTFYRSSEPGAPPFVEVGDSVKKSQVLCIIEAMKLMNEIESDCAGEVVTIYVENGQAVQFGDRLFAVRLS